MLSKVDVAQIRALEDELLGAMKKGDINQIAELLHDDLLFVIPTGQTVTKQIDLANYESGKLKIDEISATDHEVSVIGDTAVVSVIINLEGVFAEQPIKGKFKYLRVWKRFEEKWQVIGGAGIAL